MILCLLLRYHLPFGQGESCDIYFLPKSYRLLWATAFVHPSLHFLSFSSGKGQWGVTERTWYSWDLIHMVLTHFASSLVTGDTNGTSFFLGLSLFIYELRAVETHDFYDSDELSFLKKELFLYLFIFNYVYWGNVGL